ncbi:QWRF motif-containing protein 2-like [Rutidosis leptorrhynchoides]|uniref:QWRF motif-containing protein 2-like n=1 Tax=Rutidosis leptorrhynchoides TaxID=125765 RepID=UPI003A98FD35
MFDKCDFDDLYHDVSDNVKGDRRHANVVPARFLKESINLLKRPPLLKNNKVLDDGLKLSPIRNGLVLVSNNNMGITSSFLSSFLQMQGEGMMGEKKINDAHLLILLYNKHVQWRFVNAKVDAAMAVQRATEQKSLYNAWVTVSKLWHSVIAKCVEIQQIKKNLKLYSVLKMLMSYFDNCDLNETYHSISLDGTILALESSALCVPVISGEKENVKELEDACCSAVDVMQAMNPLLTLLDISYTCKFFYCFSGILII